MNDGQGREERGLLRTARPLPAGFWKFSPQCLRWPIHPLNSHHRISLRLPATLYRTAFAAYARHVSTILYFWKRRMVGRVVVGWMKTFFAWVRRLGWAAARVKRRRATPRRACLLYIPCLFHMPAHVYYSRPSAVPQHRAILQQLSMHTCIFYLTLHGFACRSAVAFSPVVGRWTFFFCRFVWHPPPPTNTSPLHVHVGMATILHTACTTFLHRFQRRTPSEPCAAWRAIRLRACKTPLLKRHFWENRTFYMAAAAYCLRAAFCMRAAARHRRAGRRWRGARTVWTREKEGTNARDSVPLGVLSLL